MLAEEDTCVCRGRGVQRVETHLGWQTFPCPDCEPEAFLSAVQHMDAFGGKPSPTSQDTTMTTPTLSTDIESMTDALLAHDETEISRLQAERERMVGKIRELRAAGERIPDELQRDYIRTGDRLRTLLVVAMDQPVPDSAEHQAAALGAGVEAVKETLSEALARHGEVIVPPTPEGMAIINRALAEASAPTPPQTVAKPAPELTIDHVQLRRDVGHSMVHVLWRLTGSETVHSLNHPIGKGYGSSYREAAEALDGELITLRNELGAMQRRIAVVVAAAAWMRDH